VNTHPTDAKLVIAEPRSLLGRQYRDVRVRRSITVDLSPRRISAVRESDEPVTRSERFHAIQRRRTEFGAHGERLPDHGVNLLSNQSSGSPPALQTPIPSPTRSYPNTSVEPEPSTPPVRTRKYVKHRPVRVRVAGKNKKASVVKS
jgi:hypothetical protein